MLIFVVILGLAFGKNYIIDFSGKNDVVHITAKVGTPGIKIYLPLNLNNNYTWISEHDFSSLLSESSRIEKKNISLYIGKKAFKGLILNDYISFLKDRFSLKFFSVSANTYFVRDSGFGFGYYFLNKDFSLVHQLWANLYIDKCKFTLVKNGNKGNIYFGDLPNELRKEYKYNVTIEIDSKQKSPKWISQNLKYVIFDGKIKYQYRNNDIVSFDSMGGLKIPFKVYKSLSNNVFKKCEKENSNKLGHYYICNKKHLIDFGKLGFVFGGKIIEVDIGQLFDCDGDICKSEIRSIEEDENEWEIGYRFWKEFMVSFEYEGKIIFFSKNIFRRYCNVYIYIYVLCLIINCIGLFLNLQIKLMI